MHRNIMKLYYHIRLFTILAAAAGPVPHAAAQFSSGSNESYGPMNIAANTTLVMPPDGIFHCTTISITNAATLNFTKNAKNTPVYLLATGDVTIQGSIDVRGTTGTGGQPGLGGPGGYDGGRSTSAGSPAGWGHGPGGGTSGTGTSVRGGSHRTNALLVTGATYGNPLLLPLTGGSGGGGRTDALVGGGGGGGALLIASNTRIVLSPTGASPEALLLRASGGGDPDGAGGSGGAIRLVAPVVTSNTVATYISFHAGGITQALPEGSGWARIDTLSAGGLALFHINGYSPFNLSGTMGANLIVFPPALPKVEIIEAAGQAVDPDAASPPVIVVPSGGPLTQTVRVRVRNFGGTALLAVVLTPESGARTTVNLDIPNPGPGTNEGTATVTFPLNVPTRIDAWTR